MGKQGKREFVQVLRLMAVFALDDVAAAARDAIAKSNRIRRGEAPSSATSNGDRRAST
jgi:hypothetical protein